MPKKTKTNEIRIGKLKHYRGTFKVAKTGNIFNYSPYGFFSSYKFMKSLKPTLEIDEEGIYVGNGMFMIKSKPGDLFYENF